MSQIIEDLKKESDEDLLVYISMVDEPEVRNVAFTEFHRRFKDFLWNLITQICSSHYDSDDLAKAVFQNTLIAVYQYSHTFDTNAWNKKRKSGRIPASENSPISHRWADTTVPEQICTLPAQASHPAPQAMLQRIPDWVFLLIRKTTFTNTKSERSLRSTPGSTCQACLS